MRRYGSFLLMLLLIIAYGRCVADQFGMLHTTGASCCQVVCEDEHCSDVASAEHDFVTKDHDPQNQHDHDEKEKPAPCQLCLILSAEGATLEPGIKIPTPQSADYLNPASVFPCSDWSTLSLRIEDMDSSLFLPDVPLEEHKAHRLRAITRSLPIRGPSRI